MKDGRLCHRQKCSSWTLVSGNSDHANIRGVLWREGVKRQLGSRKQRFSVLSPRYIFGIFRDKAKIIIWQYIVLIGFPLIPQ